MAQFRATRRWGNSEGRQRGGECGMSAQGESSGFLMSSRRSGVVVVRLTGRAIEAPIWQQARSQLRALLRGSTAGMVVDCRELPVGAAATVAPVLYELMVAGRRRVPRIEVGAVGE